jgi:hypothetical protein
MLPLGGTSSVYRQTGSPPLSHLSAKRKGVCAGHPLTAYYCLSKDNLAERSPFARGGRMVFLAHQVGDPLVGAAEAFGELL